MCYACVIQYGIAFKCNCPMMQLANCEKMKIFGFKSVKLKDCDMISLVQIHTILRHTGIHQGLVFRTNVFLVHSPFKCTLL